MNCTWCSSLFCDEVINDTTSYKMRKNRNIVVGGGSFVSPQQFIIDNACGVWGGVTSEGTSSFSTFVLFYLSTTWGKVLYIIGA
jgi:hypothetical protein